MTPEDGLKAKYILILKLLLKSFEMPLIKIIVPPQATSSLRFTKFKLSGLVQLKSLNMCLTLITHYTNKRCVHIFNASWSPLFKRKYDVPYCYYVTNIYNHFPNFDT